MKIAISSKGNDLESELDPRFGRAQYFIIYDTSDDKFEVIDNTQNLNAAQGAGIQAAQNVANEDVGLAISGNFGPKAYDTLKAAGIETAICSNGTIGDAIELFKNKKLKFVDGANVKGHWV